MRTWTISEADVGERLDLFLTGKMKDKTRSAIQKMIKNGQVTVNGNLRSVHRFLKQGDVVVWGEDHNPSAPPRRRRGGAPPLVVRGGKIEAPVTVAETDDWVVINKPAGLLVHPDAQTKQGTLIDWLITHDPSIARVGENPERPGIVHRLDREVSGLMIVAKNPAAYETLQKQFAERKVDKTYVALVHGTLSKEEGDIKLSIARSSSKARMAARPAGDGKAAWTHYRVLERFVGATLVELHILSGRTHQIRAHLYALGHPVIGDTLYMLRQTARRVETPRLMLESVGIAFDDVKTGERRAFTIEPDPNFDSLIRTFRHVHNR